MSDELALTEKTALAQAEGTIERGLKTFYEVGAALMEIKDGRLYREGFKTFEDYCRERWGVSRIRAHQLIDSVRVEENLLTIVNTGAFFPATESQARILVPLEPDEQREVWVRPIEKAPTPSTSSLCVAQSRTAQFS